MTKNKLDPTKIESKAVPSEVIYTFFTFLEQSNTTTKKYYEVDGDTRILTREVEEIRPNDLKSTLSLFEKLYPEYFDQLTIEKLEKLRKESGSDELDKFKSAAKKMLQFPGQEQA